MSEQGVTLGVDVGSRTTKLVRLREGQVDWWEVFPTGARPLEWIAEQVAQTPPGRAVATGYGRELLRERLGTGVVSELGACARGLRHVAPQCRTVIDVGGQDAKVLRLDEQGQLMAFEMNDRCAAGTGRFLEVMASALGYETAAFGPAALQAEQATAVSSMCTVFAESEVITLLAGGADRGALALGLHQAIVERIWTLVARVGAAEPVALVGGVAHNPAVARLLQERLQEPLVLPSRPQISSALGAALLAAAAEPTGGA